VTGSQLKSLGSRFRQLLGNSASLILVIVGWELLVRLNILDYRFFPTPSSVIVELIELTVSGELLIHIAASLQRVILGFGIGAFLGLVVGLAMGWSRLAEKIADPLISVFYPIPKTALLPLILIIFGIGESGKVAIVAIAVFFTVVINTAAGVRSIEPVIIDAARNYGARGMRMFIKVVIPAAMPEIFTGLRLGLGIGLVVIIAAEFVASNQGLGYMVWLAWGTLATKRMYAGLVVIGIIGLITTRLLQWLGKKLMPWYTVEERALPQKTGPIRVQKFNVIRFFGKLQTAIFTYSREYLYVLPNEVELPKPIMTLEGVKFRWIDEANVDAIRPWKGWRDTNQFRRYLFRGMIGIYAFHKGQVIGYVWGTIKTSKYAVSCTHHPIEVADGLTRTAEVLPEFRRHGVASYLRYTLIVRIREIGPILGTERICGTVLVQNTPMMKLAERQGSIRDQEHILIRITPWIFIRRIWALDAQGRKEEKSGRLSIKFKVPEFLSDPIMKKIFGRGIVETERAWQPQGEA
jgi:NitT/TauT family transport system permease protein